MSETPGSQTEPNDLSEKKAYLATTAKIAKKKEKQQQQKSI